MGDDEKPKAASAYSVTEKFVGLPLWEEVKKTIYGYWTTANHLLYVIDVTRVQTKDLKDFGGASDRFRASVMRLYRACRPKLGYHAKETCVKDIRKMKPDEFLKQPADLKLADAITLFVLLSDFIEKDGITFFETKRATPDHSLMHGLETEDYA